MVKLPSLPLFVDDYEAATVHLTLEEDGCYNRLLRLSWRQSDCSIPADAAWVARRMRCDEETYKRLVEPILNEFFVQEDGRWLQKRLREEHEYVLSVSSMRSEAGSKGGKVRALKNKDSGSSPATILPEPGLSKPQAPIPIPIPTVPSGEESPEGSGLSRTSAQARARGLDDPPDWLPIDAWNEWCRMRARKKKPVDSASAKLNLVTLTRFREQGHDPLIVIQQSTERSWDGFYEPKEERKGAQGNGRTRPRQSGFSSLDYSGGARRAGLKVAGAGDDEEGAA